MDVYHKVLAKVYEITGGKETVDVDLTDLLKREGFFPSIESISSHLNGESWVTETSRKYTVRLTHWGAAEAKRILADIPDTDQIIAKDAGKLLSQSREFVIMLEEFASDQSKGRFKAIEKRFSDIGTVVERIKANL